MTNSTPSHERRPRFNTTDDFVMPQDVSDEDWAAIEEALDTTHYITAALATERVHQQVLRGRDLTRPVGPFAVRAFALHLIQPTEEGIGLETVVSTPQGSNADFVHRLAKVALVWLPPKDFPFPIVSISRTLQQMGLKVATGVTIYTDRDDPSQDKEFVSLVVPRIYMDQFRPNYATNRQDFAVKLAALSFAFLSSKYLESLEATPQNGDPIPEGDSGATAE